jgi:hypothetical protein
MKIRFIRRFEENHPPGEKKFSPGLGNVVEIGYFCRSGLSGRLCATAWHPHVNDVGINS